MTAIERENESLKQVTQKYADDDNSYNYDNYYDSGAYGGESYDSTADNPSTVSASAPQGADTNGSYGDGRHRSRFRNAIRYPGRYPAARRQRPRNRRAVKS